MPSISRNYLNHDERSLLEEIASGNPQLFWYLWQVYRDYLYRRCLYWMNGDPDDASDALSIALLRAWDKLPDHANKITDCKAWLTRVTQNICFDIHRKRQRTKKYTDNLERIIDGRETIPVSGHPSPESLLLDREFGLYLRASIDRLPDRLRQPVILHYYDRKNYRTIARILSISEDNVAKRIQQARALLRGKLQGYLAGVEGVEIEESRETPENSFSREKLPVKISSSCIDYRVTALCLQTRRPYPFLSGEYRA